MGQAASDAGKKLLAIAVLVLAGWFLLKVVFGFVATLVWIALALVALVGVVWAVRTLN
jgi:O-antigen ligase